MASELDDFIKSQKGAVTDDSGNTTAYAPTIAAKIAASTSPNLDTPDIYDFGDPGSRAFRQAHSADLDERKFAFDELHKKHQETMADLRQADEHLTTYLSNTKQRIAMQDDLDRKADAADFLRKFSAVSHTDPQYEDKVAMLAALHPLAGSDPTVKELLTTKHEARQVYNETMKTGGAAAFEGPARDTYVNTFKQTGDIIQAHAAAKRVDKDHQQFLKDVAEGNLNPADLPEWSQGGNRPAAYNEDGSLNYQHLRMLASTRAGERTGKMAQADSKEEDRDLRTIHTLGSDTAALMRNPELKSVFDAAVARQASRDKEKAGTPMTQGATGAGATSKYLGGL
jgi:hypothetical protein